MTTTLTVVQPDPPEIVAQTSALVRDAEAFHVGDLASNALALERIRLLRLGERTITEHFEPARKAADEVKRAVLATRDALVRPLMMARSVYDAKAQEYEREQRRIAEAERQRLEKLAREEEERRQLDAAIEADEAGATDEAIAILEQPVIAPVVHVAPAVAQVEGVSERTTWHAEVTDLQALVRYVARYPEWLGLLEPAMPALNGLARSQRGAMNLPGVRAVSEASRSVRR